MWEVIAVGFIVWFLGYVERVRMREGLLTTMGLMVDALNNSSVVIEAVCAKHGVPLDTGLDLRTHDDVPDGSLLPSAPLPRYALHDGKVIDISTHKPRKGK